MDHRDGGAVEMRGKKAWTWYIGVGMDTRSHTTRLTLLSRVRDPRDAAAWREFEETYREMLLRFCLSQGVQHADGEDAVQRVFMSLSRTLPGFTYDPARGRFRDYLFRSVRNAISGMRAKRRPIVGAGSLEEDGERGDGIVEGAAGTEPSPAEAAAWEKEWIAHHYRRALARVRDQFDARSVEVFERNIGGVSVQLLGQEFGMSEDAIYKLRTRIRARMQELVEEQIVEEDTVQE